MELIIINIGLQRGIIEPTLFSIMVAMAIVTTLMATPLFEWVYGRHARRMHALSPPSEEDREGLGEMDALEMRPLSGQSKSNSGKPGSAQDPR
jgi:hypothetical protein